ncbi:hypothetical protein [Uliginosibacterium aquaticum]|uniref:Uncharacterized protein n=1 Tax=Uliginosibacterium aquaticum TaxID=2731212 RepID=A0ABX2IJ21_9RHOO|nr:hypothetical protein [Uliginosibacterium aquaticum]NSL56789.1 hypothetical protein [Uliginosibacterium aquaticum]
MKRVLCVLFAGLLCTGFAQTAAAATTSSKKPVSKQSASKPVPAKPAGKTTGKKAGARKPAGKTAGTSAALEGCKMQRVRTAKGWTSRKVCNVPVEKTLSSPIARDALDKPAADGPETEVKARSAPDRAYAVDGDTFFYQGRKYKVAGLQGDSSDMAKQRLQKQLESGSLMIDPLSTDASGLSTATVRINGRNLADRME